MNSIAMSGCTGAIGTALIKKCIEEGVKVYAYVRPDSERRDRIPRDRLVKISDYDLSDFDKMSRLSGLVTLPKADAFIHMGWAGTIGDSRNDAKLQELNIKYTLDAVRLAHSMGAKVFIGVGSQAEYGRVEGELKPDTPTRPENGYGMAKLAAGGLSRLMCEKLGMKHIWVRVLSVYGPYDGEATMIIGTIRKLLNGECPALTAGDQIWDYLYSDDAARAIYMLADKAAGEGMPDESKIYCLGSGQGRPLKEYIGILRDLINKDLPLGFGEVPYSDK